MFLEALLAAFIIIIIFKYPSLSLSPLLQSLSLFTHKIKIKKEKKNKKQMTIRLQIK
jgi:hypothetical protein